MRQKLTKLLTSCVFVWICGLSAFGADSFYMLPYEQDKALNTLKNALQNAQSEIKSAFIASRIMTLLKFCGIVPKGVCKSISSTIRKVMPTTNLLQSATLPNTTTSRCASLAVCAQRVKSILALCTKKWQLSIEIRLSSARQIGAKMLSKIILKRYS